MDFPAKRPAREADVLPASIEKPYNHVNDETTQELQNVPRRARKSVAEGYRTLPSGPAPRARDDPIFSTSREDRLRAQLDLITTRHELTPYSDLRRDPEPGEPFYIPPFPGASAERKRNRDTSPSSSPNRSRDASPLPLAVDSQGDISMEDDSDATPRPQQGPFGDPADRPVKQLPKRTMSRTVFSAPAGGLGFGGGTRTVGNGIGDNIEEGGDDKEIWRRIDFTAYAARVPE